MSAFLRRIGVIAATSRVPACVRTQVSGANDAIRVVFAASTASAPEDLRGNGIKIESGSHLTLGPRLAIHRQRETFAGHEQASRLLTRPYRASFVVPQAV